MLPSINQITNFAILRDDTRIPLTEQQFNTLEFKKNNEKSTTLVEIRDPNNREQLFYGELNQIKGFSEKKKTNKDGLVYTCDFGIKHDINIECNCRYKFQISPNVFKGKAYEMFENLQYIQDITEQQRLQVLKSL